LIEDRRKVVLRGAGKHVGSIHQRKSPLVTAAPRSLHLRSIKSGVGLAAQAFGRNQVRRVQDALENDAVGWNDRHHLTDYRPGSRSKLRKCSVFGAATDRRFRRK
jgi:hypothetical protein